MKTQKLYKNIESLTKMKTVTNINNIIKLYYDFSVLKAELYKKSTFLKHVCYCRTNIMDRYIESICNLTLLLSGFFLDADQMGRCGEERRKAILNRYFKIFTTQAYGLFKNGDLLNYKTLLLFKKMQGYIEKKIFLKIEKDFDLLLTEKNKSFDKIDDITTLNEYHTCILNYMHMLGEIGILTLSSLKINCEYISDCIFENSYDIDPKTLEEYKIKTENFFNTGGACHRRLVESPIKELMHIFLLDDYMDDSAGFVKNCIELAHKYCINPNNLKVILDFGLSESDNLCTADIAGIIELNKINKMYVTNCLDIDFCEYNDIIFNMYIDKNGIKNLCLTESQE